MTALPFITALARAGALDQAWHLFRQGGFAERADDPAALAVKGRLLKDRGLLLAGEPRRQKLIEAADAYAAAHALAPMPYLAINVATLCLLSGQQSRAEHTAREVLALLTSSQSQAETPYWLSATKAEALLLLDETDKAATALAEARAASPDNFADQASTVRQLGLILSAKRGDLAWLAPHRPPHCLHYSGHLAVAEQSPVLAEVIGDWLALRKIGAGFGALAAGADILIAEALLSRGAELHVVLPVRTADFIEQSVRPYGLGWVPRFEACLAAATSLRETSTVTGPYEPLATSLAADMAMGHTVMQARQWETSALQLLIADRGEGSFGEGTATARDGAIWQGLGREQHMIRAPRETNVAPSMETREGRPDRVLSAVVLVRISGLDQLEEGEFAQQLDLWLAQWWHDVHGFHAVRTMQQGAGNDRIFAFASPAPALEFINRTRSLTIQPQFPATVCGHYALLHQTEGALAGPGLVRLSAMAEAALPGTTVLSDALASVMALYADGLAMEPMGEVNDQPLFALK
jgi:MAP3K TRAFs-binding domain